MEKMNPNPGGLSSDPLVSVCVTTFQHREYIRDCLEGILMQKTKFPFEILLGEDESTDGTREICIDYASRFPDKIRLFLRSRNDVIYINGRPTGRYNFSMSLKACKGKYIALCEGDDYWTDPLKLQKQVDFLEMNPDFSICFHPVRFRWQDDPEKKAISKIEKSFFDVKDIINSNFISTVSCMFRNRLPTEFPNWFYKLQAGDWGLHIMNALHGKIFCLDEVMAVYRINSSSTWINNSYETRIKYAIDMLKIFRENFSPELYTEFSKSIAGNYYNLLEASRRKGEWCNPWLLLKALKEEGKLFQPTYFIRQMYRLVRNHPLR